MLKEVLRVTIDILRCLAHVLSTQKHPPGMAVKHICIHNSILPTTATILQDQKSYSKAKMLNLKKNVAFW